MKAALWKQQNSWTLHYLPGRVSVAEGCIGNDWQLAAETYMHRYRNRIPDGIYARLPRFLGPSRFVEFDCWAFGSLDTAREHATDDRNRHVQ